MNPEEDTTRCHVYPEDSEEIRTKQSFKEDCDINAIVRKCSKGKMLTHVAKSPPQFGDFTTGGLDFRDSLHAVQEAQAAFMELPASIRAAHENDPAKLMEWLDDPANQKQAEEKGLISPPHSKGEEPEAPPANPPEEGGSPPSGQGG